MPIIPDRPRLRGRLTYLPAPSGAAVPINGARVRIWDKDAGADDLLIDTTTNSTGRFSKRATRNWRDTIRVRGPFGTSTRVPDASDLPILWMRIDDAASGNSMQGPFPYLGETVDTPIVATWTAPGAQVIKINNTVISENDNPDQIWETVKDLVEANQPITLDLGGPMGDALKVPFNGANVDYDDFRTLMCTVLGLDPNSLTLRVNPDPATLTALVIIVGIVFMGSPIAIGGSVFMMTMGLAVILAVLYGYRVEVERTDSISGPSSNSVPIPLFDLKITLIPPS